MVVKADLLKQIRRASAPVVTVLVLFPVSYFLAVLLKGLRWANSFAAALAPIFLICFFVAVTVSVSVWVKQRRVRSNDE